MGASKGNLGATGAGGVIKDSKNQGLFAFSSTLENASNNCAEMQAFLIWLTICYQLEIFEVDVETDSMLLKQWFSKDVLPPWILNDIWRKILDFREFISIIISYIFREMN